MAERRDVKLLRKHLSRRYSDKKGRKHQDINGMLTYYVLRRGTISVFLVRSNVLGIDRTRSPLSARVTATAVLARGGGVKSLADVLPTAARALHFDLRLEKEDDDTWRLVAATWRDAGTVSDILGTKK